MSSGKVSNGANGAAATVANVHVSDVLPPPAFFAVTDQEYVVWPARPDTVYEVEGGSTVAESRPAELAHRTV